MNKEMEDASKIAELMKSWDTKKGEIMERDEVKTEQLDKIQDTSVELRDYIRVMPKSYVERDEDEHLEFWQRINPDTMEPISQVALIGVAGSGKNYMIERYAAKMGLPLLIVPCDDSLIFREMIGSTQVKGGMTYYQEGILVSFLTSPSVVLIDEVNSLPPSRLFMLHELFQNRRLFVKDTNADRSVINLHPECRLFTAMNPCQSAYSGTNRINVALGNRTSFIEIPKFRSIDIKIDLGKELVGQIRKFYDEVNRLIEQQNMRVVISKRNIDRIVIAIKMGASIRQAVMEGFINSALATAGITERDSLHNIALSVFGEKMAVGYKVSISDDAGEV